MQSLIADKHSNTELKKIVLQVELLQRESICGFHEDKKSPFLKITIVKQSSKISKSAFFKTNNFFLK